MSSSLSARNFLEAAESIPVIDVRSPSEFKQGHIPGAHNLPLFDDEERAEIGTLYKQESRESAFKKGLEIVGPKMRSLVEKSEDIAPEGKILIHCWRGGMRSSSVAWLLETAGFDARTLEGGYKTFRNFVLDIFEETHNLLILSGYTGSGKTEILYELRDLGEQIIDLEGLANHKGSAFGHLGEDQQPTGEQFQNLLGMKLFELDKQKPVWLEDESRFIGRRMIPKQFFDQMRTAPVLRMKIPREVRINRIVDDYGEYSRERLKKSIKKIKKRLGGLRTQQAVEALENGKLNKVVEHVLHFYDKAYDHGLSKREPDTIHRIEFDKMNLKSIARSLREYAFAEMN